MSSAFCCRAGWSGDWRPCYCLTCRCCAGLRRPHCHWHCAGSRGNWEEGEEEGGGGRREGEEGEGGWRRKVGGGEGREDGGGRWGEEGGGGGGGGELIMSVILVDLAYNVHMYCECQCSVCESHPSQLSINH